MKNVPWCYKCTGDVCVSTEPYIYIAAQIGKALAEIFTKHGDLLEGAGEA